MSAIRAGKAFVELYADKSALVRGLKSAESSLKAWGGKVVGIGKTVMAAGAALATPFATAAKMFSDMGSTLNDAAARTGASVESLSTLGFAAEQTGATLDDVERGMKAMAKQGLGAGMKTEDAFRAGLKAVAAIEDPMLRAQKAQELFGKSGMKLIPMAIEMEQLESRAKSLGIQMSTKDAAAADALGDAWGELWSVGKTLVFQAGAALAPALQAATTWIVNIAAAAIGWLKENRELVLMVAAVAAGLVVAGAAILAFGTALSVVGAIIGTLVTVGSTLAAIGGAIVTFVISPVGLLVAALVAGGAAFLTYTETGQAALQWLADMFSEIKTHALTTFQGISDALAAGNIALAAQILWNSLRVVWLTGTNWLNQKWVDFLNLMLPATMELAGKISDVFVDMVAGVIKSMLAIADVASKLTGIDVLGKGVREAWDMALPVLTAGLKGAGRMQIAGAGGALLGAGQADVSQSEQDLAEAKAEFIDSVQLAGDERKRIGTEGPRQTGLGAAAGLDQVKTSVAGTFSAAAAGGLASGGQLDQIAAATKETAKHTKRLAGLKGGIGFA